MTEEGGSAGGSERGSAPEEAVVARYSVPQAARVLGISERGVRQRIKAGTLTAERDGTRWIVFLLPEERGSDGGSVPGTLPPEAVVPAEERGSIPPSTAPGESVPADLYREQQARIDRLQHEKEQAMQQAAYYQGQLEELREHLRLLTDARHGEQGMIGKDEGDTRNTPQGSSGYLEHEGPVNTETKTRPWWRRIIGR